MYRQQLTTQGEIFARGGVHLPSGEKVFIRTILKTGNLDTLWSQLGFRGFTGQLISKEQAVAKQRLVWTGVGTGLVHVIDAVMEGGERTRERMLELKVEIIELARELSEDC